MLTDESIIALTQNCPNLLEIDVVNCSITNDSLVSIFTHCRELRELKVNQCQYIHDFGFIKSPLTTGYYDQLRILDLTNVVQITDKTVECITLAAPKIRNLILNKCVNITDHGITSISRLGRYLHYIHLGSCRHITDEAVIHLASKCTRIRYIDLASCHKLGDDTVLALASLPKLKRIGLVKCTRITNRAILALTRNARTSVSLERIHLSYCDQLTVQAISVLVMHCKRLTHLSLSFVPAFQHQEFQQFCRPPPKEYNAEYQRAFCVFSGQNVHTLRSYFKSTWNSSRIMEYSTSAPSQRNGGGVTTTTTTTTTISRPYSGTGGNANTTTTARIEEISDHLQQRVHIVN
jgi:F-box and leucine-rich repeat protein GRR1